MPDQRKTADVPPPTEAEFAAIGKSAQRKASLRPIPVIAIGYADSMAIEINSDQPPSYQRTSGSRLE